MQANKTLVLIAAVHVVVTTTAATVVINAQEKQLKKMAEFSKSLIDVIGEYEPIVQTFEPDKVQAMHEKLVFDATVRNFND